MNFERFMYGYMFLFGAFMVYGCIYFEIWVAAVSGFLGMMLALWGYIKQPFKKEIEEKS